MPQEDHSGLSRANRSLFLHYVDDIPPMAPWAMKHTYLKIEEADLGIGEH